MPIEPYKNSGGIQNSKIFKVGVGFATGGPVGAGLALVSSNNPGLGNMAKIGMAANKNDQNPMQRRMDSQNQASENDPKNPDHMQTIEDGKNALINSDLPQEQKDHIYSIFTAAQTHGPGGFSTDHLFDNQPNQSYLDQSTGD